MSAIKLEPCPFCGEHLKEISDGYFQHSVNSCFFEAWEYDFGGSPSMVLDWNRRAQPAEEVQKDADRYRWLRDPMSGNTRHDPKVYKDGPQEDVEWAYGEELDAMVDEAKARDDAQRAKWRKKP